LNILIPLILAAAALIAGYRWYGGLIAQKVGIDPERQTPAHEFEDGRDYVPTPSTVVFSHHYASIAGAGPILGPTLALAFGVVPVMLWAVLGGIFFGAVHDFSAMFVAIRERGRSIAETIRKILGPVGFLLFTMFLLVMLVMVNASFLRASATALTSRIPLAYFGLKVGQHLLPVTRDDPGVAQIGGIASTSVIIITLCAPFVGFLIHRRHLSASLSYLLALVIVLVSVLMGLRYPVRLQPEQWMIALSIYCLLASGIPVWLLLQPRDFVNVVLLYAGIVLLFLAAIGAGMRGAEFQAPMIDLTTGQEKLGLIWPVLFITVACGAISGFHALVAGGTSCKQVKSESDIQRIGFGAMLLETMLAVIVITAVGYGLARGKYLEIVHPATTGAASNPVLAFALGAGALMHQGLFLPSAIGTVIGVLMLEGFIVTTLDTAIRLNRYVLEEFWEGILGRRLPILSAYWFNAGLAVALMLLMAHGNTLTTLWPVFGTGNQLLAALTLTAVSAWLARMARPCWYTLVPAMVMIATTTASLITLLLKHLKAEHTVLAVTDIILLALSALLVVMAANTFLQPRRVTRRAEIPTV